MVMMHHTRHYPLWTSRTITCMPFRHYHAFLTEGRRPHNEALWCMSSCKAKYQNFLSYFVGSVVKIKILQHQQTLSANELV